MGQSHRQGSQEQVTRAKALKALEGQLNPQIREVIRPTPHRRLLKINEYVPVSGHSAIHNHRDPVTVWYHTGPMKTAGCMREE